MWGIYSIYGLPAVHSKSWKTIPATLSKPMPIPSVTIRNLYITLQTTFGAAKNTKYRLKMVHNTAILVFY